MKKQIVSFLMAAFLFAPCLRSLKFEVTDKEFTFILDDKDNSAILKDIYIPLKTKKKLEKLKCYIHPDTKYCLYCKDCEKLIRIEKGVVAKHDKREKVPQVQTRKTD